MATVEEVAIAMADVLGVDDDDNLLEEWRYVDNLFGRMPDPIAIWRAIGLREGESLDKGKLGLFWTWEREAAKAYNKPSGANIVVVHSEVFKDDVDWPTTFALNIRLPEEKEIRLLPGANIELLE